MEEGLDRDSAHARSLGRTADLLVRIAGILEIDPSYFLQERGARAEPAATADDLGELLRLFRTIEDSDTRRAALDLIRILQMRADKT